MGSLSATHWLVIAGLFVVLFGAKRLPDAARSVGRSLRIFKSEVQEMRADAPEPGESSPAPARAPAVELPAPARAANASAAPGSARASAAVSPP